MGGSGSKSGLSKSSWGKSDVISLNVWKDRIYINGLTSGSDKIWIEQKTTDYGTDYKPVEDWEINYSQKSYGYNLAKDYVERWDSDLYKELDKIKNGKKTFAQLFDYAQKKK